MMHRGNRKHPQLWACGNTLVFNEIQLSMLPGNACNFEHVTAVILASQKQRGFWTVSYTSMPQRRMNESVFTFWVQLHVDDVSHH